MKNKLIELIKIGFYILIYCLILKVFNITCPIKFITGVSCAGCGMTRAWLSFITGDIDMAFYYHPLFWTIPIFALIYLFKDRMPRKVFIVIIVVCITAFLVVYAFRMADPNNAVVVCNLKDSFVYKLLIGG